MNEIALKAYAKVNLGLIITSKRKDGYHEIETVFQRIDLSDLIIIKLEKHNNIIVRGNSKNVPNDEANICYNAAKLLKEYSGFSSGINISIDKVIPMGAGLGGGSSDAAATLIGLNELLNLKLSENELFEIAHKIGADVPFFLKGGTMLATGIGEKLTIVNVPTSYYCVIIYPNLEISTKWVYKNFTFDLTKTKKSIKLTEIFSKELCFFGIKEIVRNDLEEVVFPHYPIIRDIKQQFYRMGAFFACMSGSGSAVYGLFEDFDRAVEVMGVFPKPYQKFLSRPI